MSVSIPIKRTEVYSGFYLAGVGRSIVAHANLCSIMGKPYAILSASEVDYDHKGNLHLLKKNGLELARKHRYNLCSRGPDLAIRSIEIDREDIVCMIPADELTDLVSNGMLELQGRFPEKLIYPQEPTTDLQEAIEREMRKYQEVDSEVHIAPTGGDSSKPHINIENSIIYRSDINV